MAKGMKPPVPSTHWPESTPSPNEEKIISVSVGNTHISWAIHQGVNQGCVPTLFWRTPHVDLDQDGKEGTSCEILSTYLSDGARELLFGSKSADTTQQLAIRASTKRRVSLISVYIVSTNDAQLETLASLMRDLPCRMYLMQGDDFFTKEEGRYNGMGVDRLATMRAAGDYKGFPALVIDGGTAMTYTAADKNGKILGGGIGPGVQVKLRSLGDYASALPLITCDSLMKELASLMDDKGVTLKTLPVFARTPKQNIVTNLCREIAFNGQSAIQSFLGKVGDVEPNDPANNDSAKCNPNRLVYVTGGDADLIARLIAPDCSKLIEMEPGKTIPSPPQYKVKKMKHMVHYGISVALKQKAAKFEESPTADMDALLIGQRIAKKFPEADDDGDFIYRGAISCVHKNAKFPYGIHYDDGDAEDLSVVDLYEALELYIKLGEKDRDAGESSRESQLPRSEKISGAQEAANALAKKDDKVKESIEKKQPKKPTPPPAAAAQASGEPESAPKRPAPAETSVSEEKPTGRMETSGPAPRKKVKKSPPTLTKPEFQYEGDRVAKYFAGEVYFGTVGEYWFDNESKDYFWRITYDDGDAEDVKEGEFLELLELYEKEKANDPSQKK